MVIWLFLYGLSSLPGIAGLPLPAGEEELLSSASLTIADILRTTTQPWCSVVLVTDGESSAAAVRQVLKDANPLFGTRLFEVSGQGWSMNQTREELSAVIRGVTLLRNSYHCLTVLAVSNSYEFLDAFLNAYGTDFLLVWKQRPLLVTSLDLSQLKKLLESHWRHFTTSAMALQVHKIPDGKSWLSVYSHLPYGPAKGGQVISVATWTPSKGLVTTVPSSSSSSSLFEKSKRAAMSVKEALKDPWVLKNILMNPGTFRFQVQVSVAIAVEHWFPHVIIRKLSPDGESQAFELGGSMANLLRALAQSLNFTYKLIRPADGEWGSKKPDGSWSGMVGLVYRQEADIALGPHDLTEVRSTAIDYTTPLFTDARKFIVAQNRAEVDPWGFLLPLSPPVWMGLLLSMMVIAAATGIIGRNHREDPPLMYASAVTFHTFRILVQQGLKMKLVTVSERMVVCSWVIGAMILFWSYSTNLMSLLAVRYAPRPIQTIQDLIDNEEMSVIFTPNTALTDYIENIESGSLRDLANLKHYGRYRNVHFNDFPNAMRSLVRRGDHVIATDTTDATRLIANYFSEAGSCNFYISREAFVPFVMGMIGQKGSPLVEAISHRIGAVIAGDMYRQWLDSNFANSSSCRHMPSRFTVKEPLSLTNIWGMFVLLAVGLTLAGLAFSIEVFSSFVDTG